MFRIHVFLDLVPEKPLMTVRFSRKMKGSFFKASGLKKPRIIQLFNVRNIIYGEQSLFCCIPGKNNCSPQGFYQKSVFGKKPWILGKNQLSGSFSIVFCKAKRALRKAPYVVFKTAIHVGMQTRAD